MTLYNGKINCKLRFNNLRALFLLSLHYAFLTIINSNVQKFIPTLKPLLSASLSMGYHVLALPLVRFTIFDDYKTLTLYLISVSSHQKYELAWSTKNEFSVCNGAVSRMCTTLTRWQLTRDSSFNPVSVNPLLLNGETNFDSHVITVSVITCLILWTCNVRLKTG